MIIIKITYNNEK